MLCKICKLIWIWVFSKLYAENAKENMQKYAKDGIENVGCKICTLNIKVTC
jgi:hypothetical protein